MYETSMDVSYGEYILSNRWNESAGDGRTQTMGIRTTKLLRWEWEWNYPTPGGLVKSYPSVAYGGLPYRNESTTPNLPVLLSVLPDFIVDLDSTFAVSGSCNLSFDLWFTSTPTPAIGVSSHEAMIWLDHRNEWAGDIIKRVTIDNIEYDLCPGNVFIAVTPMFSGQVNISSFIRLLITDGVLLESEYLGSIEFGSEIVSGVGKTVINSYQITRM